MLNVLALLLLASFSHAEDLLPRAPQFGAQLRPATAEELISSNQSYAAGLFLPMIVPGSSAAEGGLQVGDILFTANGYGLTTASDLTSLMKQVGSGNALELVFARAGRLENKTITLKPRPKETAYEFEIIYESAEIDGYLRRMILTKPFGDGPFPTVVLMGGLGCYSVDLAPPQPFAYRDILYEFTRNGFATVRIEKTGMGDSQGEPCAQQSLFDETHGLTEGVRSLKRFKWIDRSKLIYFGHSMGGITAPVVYQEEPCAAIVAVATSGIDWKEYEMKNTRRQLVLAGLPYDSIEYLLDRKYLAMHKLFVEHKTPEQILAEDSSFAEDVQYPAHHTFMQEVADLQFADYWKNVDAPVLFVCGTADFVVAEEEHEYARDIVNAFHPGRAEYLAIDGMDHGFNNSGTQARAFAAKGAPPSVHPDFFPKVLEFCTRAVR